MDEWINTKRTDRNEDEMIKLSQIKLPLETICREVPAEYVKQGVIREKELSLVRSAAAGRLRVREDNMKDFRILRRSMDARKKYQMQYIYQVTFKLPHEDKVLKQYGKNDAVRVKETAETTGENVQKNGTGRIGNGMGLRPVIVGMGPAGIFAALELARQGLEPIVLERGCEVAKRQQKVSEFWDTGKLDDNCNVQFGEGGAGTFSDGKLNTLVKDPTGRGRRVMQIFVDHGAPSEILYLQKPHIGTDLLGEVVQNIRRHIIELGGEVRFETKLVRAVWENETLKEIVCEHSGRQETIPCDTLILATGHSARDTVTELYQSGLFMEAKPFAVGVRVEHPQEMIGQNQYGDFYTKLPAADYKLTYNTKEKRGVYSFCMCPGGYIVNASSEPGRLAVNGMSNHARDGRNANSAIVVTVDPSDFGGTDPLSGIAFQRKWEEAAYNTGQGKVPVQLFADFCANRKSTGIGAVIPSIRGQYALANVRETLPKFIGDSIEESFGYFDRRIHGFAREDAILAGIESRTSSPVRIRRDESLQSNIRGIYPCGEGAGYAGGITSAAMDGLRVAQEIIRCLES